eukprot:scaffold115635_cov69-Phaeocystis_antarctica.AAC.3
MGQGKSDCELNEIRRLSKLSPAARPAPGRRSTRRAVPASHARAAVPCRRWPAWWRRGPAGTARPSCGPRGGARPPAFAAGKAPWTAPPRRRTSRSGREAGGCSRRDLHERAARAARLASGRPSGSSAPPPGTRPLAAAARPGLVAPAGPAAAAAAGPAAAGSAAARLGLASCTAARSWCRTPCRSVRGSVRAGPRPGGCSANDHPPKDGTRLRVLATGVLQTLAGESESGFATGPLKVLEGRALGCGALAALAGMLSRRRFLCGGVSDRTSALFLPRKSSMRPEAPSRRSMDEAVMSALGWTRGGGQFAHTRPWWVTWI